MLNISSLGTDKFEHSFLNLLCFHTIDDGVHHRRNKQVYISNECGHKGRNMFSKSVNKRQADQRDVEYGYSSDMRNAGAKGFFPLLGGCNVENRVNDQDIGKQDKERVHSSSRNNCS